MSKESFKDYKTRKIKEHRDKIPRNYRKTYDRAMTGRSIRAAINSQCIECMGYARVEVKNCVSPQCPLFPYRNLKSPDFDKDNTPS